MKSRITFVVNPKSGTASKSNVVRHIGLLLDNEKFEYSVVFTQYVGHATEIASEAVSNGVDVVCAVGGDGTVNEVARALVGTSTALAIIPLGSGNGLARHLHIPTDISGAIKVINEGITELMDYGVVNSIPFFCTCGVGFDAFISMKFAQSGKRGPISYMENVLKNGLRYNPERYDIEVEDENEQVVTYNAFLISCANASQYGNNAYIAPQASVRDGLMDVTIIQPFTMIDAPQIAIQLFNGTIDQNSHIKTFRCRKLCIHRASPGVIHYDGDPVETESEVNVEIISKALKCISQPTEGVIEVGENIQNMIVSHFNDIQLRSEMLWKSNMQRNRQFVKMNMELFKKLSSKK